ncbi:MAG: DoxX family protein [Candidatus Acidiferrales bacterium]
MDSRTEAAGAGAKTIAVMRVATGIIFFLFAEYKVVGPAFPHGLFEGWIHGWVDQDQVVGFFRPVLVNVALAHPVLCALVIGWGEMAIAISLIFGWLVRPASVAGGVLMVSLALSTWYAPGRHAPVWQYFGANLAHIPLLFLFAIFYATRAGDVWGLDGRLRRPK